MFSYKEARKYVKENISGKTGTIIGYVILYYIFKGLINGVLSNLDGVLGFVTPIIVSALLTPIHVGLFRIMTAILNGKKPSFSMLFDDYKYFVNLFVIGLVFNAIIAVGYKVYIVGILLEYIYVGVLYFFIYNSNLELGDFFNKVLEKIKLYFSECVILELSYQWPIIVATMGYAIIAAIYMVITAAVNFDKLSSVTSIEDLLPLLSSVIPLLIISVIFIIIIIVLVIILVPRLLLAEAKFYSVFANDVVKKEEPKKEEKANFCSNCGAKVEGEFCSNCGNKVNK